MAAYSRFVKNLDGKSNSVEMTFPVTSGVTVTAGDFVYFASGRVSNASVAGARLIGQAQGTVTGNVAGTVKASVLVDDSAVFLVQGTTTVAAATVGQYFDLQGATGAQLVNIGSASATTGQLVLLEANPQIEPVKGDVTYGLFGIAEHASHLGL